MKQLRMSKKSKQSSGLTNKQALVMNLLGKTKGPLSAYAILDQLHDSGFRGPCTGLSCFGKINGTGFGSSAGKFERLCRLSTENM